LAKSTFHATAHALPEFKTPARLSDEYLNPTGKIVSKEQRISTYLVYRPDAGPEQALIWDTIDITVGRSKTQDIKVSDPEVSREHALFFKEGGCFRVKDLGTGIGTLVNTEPITEHELQSGDLIQVGLFSIKFGQTTQSIQPGGNTRFASELKAGLIIPSDPGAGGRTVLGFDPEDSFLSQAEPTLTPIDSGLRREMAADGSVATVDEEDPLGLSIDASALFDAKAAHGLDLEREPAASRESVPRVAPSLSRLTMAEAPETGTDSATSATRHDLQLTLELEGSTPQLATALTALCGKIVELPPLKIRVKKTAPS
jgi:pSer/pThr/pTyr-binding forkhead associated (FHA) protein